MAAAKETGHKFQLLRELAPQEMQILNLVANGYTNVQVARTMLIDTEAVRHHIDVMYRKVART